MEILTPTLRLPKSLEKVITTSNQELESWVYEVIATDLYRRGLISLGRAADVVCYQSPWTMLTVLARHDSWLRYSGDLAQQDANTLQLLLSTRANQAAGLPLVVSSTIPLVALLMMGLIDEVRGLFQQMLLPSYVYSNTVKIVGMKNAFAVQPAEGLLDDVKRGPSRFGDWLMLNDPLLFSSDDAQLPHLGIEDRACVLLAQHVGAPVVLMDDALARRHAEAAGSQVVSTAGLLLALDERGVLNFAEAIAYLQSAGLCLSPRESENMLRAWQAACELRPHALHRAAAAGDLKLVQKLVKAGAELEQEDTDERTPLYVAAEEGHDAVVRWLLQRGASPHGWSNRLRSSPFAAANDANDACANLILDALVQPLLKSFSHNEDMFLVPEEAVDLLPLLGDKFRIGDLYLKVEPLMHLEWTDRDGAYGGIIDDYYAVSLESGYRLYLKNWDGDLHLLAAVKTYSPGQARQPESPQLNLNGFGQVAPSCTDWDHQFLSRLIATNGACFGTRVVATPPHDWTFTGLEIERSYRGFCNLRPATRMTRRKITMRLKTPLRQTLPKVAKMVRTISTRARPRSILMTRKCDG